MKFKDYSTKEVSIWLTEHKFVHPDLHKYSGRALLALLRPSDVDITPFCLLNDDDERCRLLAELRGISEHDDLLDAGDNRSGSLKHQMKVLTLERENFQLMLKLREADNRQLQTELDIVRNKNKHLRDTIEHGKIQQIVFNNAKEESVQQVNPISIENFLELKGFACMQIPDAPAVTEDVKMY